MPRTNEAGQKLIKGFEALRLSTYLDERGVPTNGWGHTKGVEIGTSVTLEQAQKNFEEDLLQAEAVIERNVTVPLLPNNFAALTSLVFNLFSDPKDEPKFIKSTLLRKLNACDTLGAALEFPRWHFVEKKGVLVPNRGLLRRRFQEAALFVTPAWAC